MVGDRHSDDRIRVFQRIAHCSALTQLLALKSIKKRKTYWCPLTESGSSCRLENMSFLTSERTPDSACRLAAYRTAGDEKKPPS